LDVAGLSPACRVPFIRAAAQVLLTPTGTHIFGACVPKDVIEPVKSQTTIAAAALAGALASPAQALRHPVLHPRIGGQTVGAQLHDAAHGVLVRRDARLADAVERLGGEAPSRRALGLMPNRALGRLHARLVRDKRELKNAPPVSGTLQAIAACESGGDPHAVGGGGAFRGKYQFTYETWAAMGGSGDPASAPEPEQDRRAAQLYATAGPGQWPVCGR
jgi:hypothetical protein